MKKEKSCGAVVYNSGGNKFLIIKHLDGHWGFPKGHVEENETEIETALREVKEETGIDILINSNFKETITYSPKENVIKDVVFFLGETDTFNYKLQESEVSDAKWLSENEIYEYLIYEDELNLFKKCILYLNNK